MTVLDWEYSENVKTQLSLFPKSLPSLGLSLENDQSLPMEPDQIL